MFKKYLIFFLTLFVSHFLISNVLAQNIQKKEPIYISSLCQKFDISKGIISFVGMVSIKKGSINVFARKISFYKKNKEKILIGYGDPIIFSKIEGNKKILIIKSFKIKYEISRNRIFLIGNVSIESQRTFITADRAIYLIKSKKVEFLGKENKKVLLLYFPKKMENLGSIK